MHWRLLRAVTSCSFVLTVFACAQQGSSCASLMEFKTPDVEITKAVAIRAGTTEEIPWAQRRTAPLPAYCRVEGVMNRRTGVGGEEFGITFALAMPEKWNGDFLMQGDYNVGDYTVVSRYGAYYFRRAFHGDGAWSGSWRSGGEPLRAAYARVRPQPVHFRSSLCRDALGSQRISFRWRYAGNCAARTAN